jgi:hypothetical protein
MMMAQLIILLALHSMAQSPACQLWVGGACIGIRETFYGNVDQNGSAARSVTAMVE